LNGIFRLLSQRDLVFPFFFEPDENDSITIENIDKEKKYNIGLWDKKSVNKLYINKEPSTSSFFPHNSKVSHQFETAVWKVRELDYSSEVECDTFDNVVESKNIPDYLKLDVHGAEFKVLAGAKKNLLNNYPLVSVETWVLDIYKGAKYEHEVTKLMYDYGYQILDSFPCFQAKHKIQSKRKIYTTRFGKRIGNEVLYVKRPENIIKKDDATFIKHIALLELFGFRDVSLYMMDTFLMEDKSLHKKIYNTLIKNSEKESSYFFKIKYKVLRKMLNLNHIPSFKN